MGLLVAEACVLAVPLDVANNSNNIGCAQGWVTACGACLAGLTCPVMSHPRLDGLTDRPPALGHRTQHTKYNTQAG